MKAPSPRLSPTLGTNNQKKRRLKQRGSTLTTPIDQRVRTRVRGVVEGTGKRHCQGPGEE
eukprot:7273971-Prorocentrum_lima.AAC.1